jgi:hypothetical protein
MNVQQDKYELLRSKELKIQDHIQPKYLVFFNVFLRKSMKIEHFVAALILFLKCLLLVLFLDILKWKLVSEIWSVTREVLS